VDKCDESMTSQTTICVNVAFVRIWMLAASMERGTGRKTSLAFQEVAVIYLK